MLLCWPNKWQHLMIPGMHGLEGALIFGPRIKKPAVYRDPGWWFGT